MFIIAEAGSNHNGSVETAKNLVDAAKKAHVQSVKFQFINPLSLYVPYQYDDPTQEMFDVVKQRFTESISDDGWREIWKYAASKGMNISASVFDNAGIKLLKSLGSDYAKIASTDLNNIELLVHAAAAFDKLILSTGMSDLAEIISAVDAIKSAKTDIDLTVLHCVSLYPCALRDAGIARLAKLQNILDVKVGYSDHTIDCYAAVAALSLGVRVFEKHFTLDKSLPGFDHAHAMEPCELAHYRDTLFELYSDLESDASARKDMVTANRARRGVYYSKDLPVGHTICQDDFVYLRPSNSLAIETAPKLIGKKLNFPVKKYQPVRLEMVLSEETEKNDDAFEYWDKELKQKGMLGK